MSFYVTDWVKQTEADGSECYYPRGVNAGIQFGALDLRPAGTLVGPAFVSTPEAISGAGITKLGDVKSDALSGVLRTAIQTVTGFATGQTRLDLILAEIMTTPGRLWNPLRADRFSGIKKLVMNSELIWASIAGGASYSENWDSADSDSISAQLTWTELVTDWDIVSNRVDQITVGAELYARAEHDLATDEHYAQVTYNQFNANTSRGGPMTRMSSSATTGYLVDFRPLDTTNTYQFRSVIAGVLASIGSSAAEASLANNTDYVIKLSSPSTDVHTVQRDGVEKLSNSSVTILAFTRAGIYGRAQGANRVRLDDWSAADISSGTAVPVFDHHYRVLRAA